MSLRPGGRWTPSTQGIAGGIGSAFAGVSDQIRRVMQNRSVSPPVASGGSSSEPGLVTSPDIELVNVGSGAFVATWSPPTVQGNVAAYGATVSLSSTTYGLGVLVVPPFATKYFTVHDGNGFDQVIYTGPVPEFGVILSPEGSMDGATARFSVVSW